MVKIAQFPSKYIFNRYGELPNVFMFWNPIDSGWVEWEIDQAANTKAGWLYNMESSMIIAVK
jgi:hypothetical protein